MPRITIELDDETLDLLRKAAPPAGASVAAHATNMPERPPWHTDVILTERVMRRVWEALVARGHEGLPANDDHASVQRGVTPEVSSMMDDIIREYRPVLDRLAQ